MSSPIDPAAAHARELKQAVVLVHGMGEQIPMDTIKGFVRTVWELDPTVSDHDRPYPNEVWSKPDDRTGSLELRRIATRASKECAAFPDRVRTDFYELYWADLTAGSTWEQFVGWVRFLLLRPWSRVPKDVRSAWVLLWVGSLAVVVIGLAGLIPEAAWKYFFPEWLPQKLLLVISAASAAVLHRAATRSFGRVVRYTRADPDNIAARAAVRARGLAMLRALHKDDEYTRIVLVGHSLGAILAYDLLSHFWAEQDRARSFEVTSPVFDKVCLVERAAQGMEDDPDKFRSAFRNAQADLRRAMVAAGEHATDPRARWLISDFVTLGSPLAHADFLLAKGMDDLRARQKARELPTAPPFCELLDPDVVEAARATGKLPVDRLDRPRLMVFPQKIGGSRWILHHAAVFAAVRWTNLYDPAAEIVHGDLIGGPHVPVFGEAIEDVDLNEGEDQRSLRFTHTLYWDETGSPERIAKLRRSINLLDI